MKSRLSIGVMGCVVHCRAAMEASGGSKKMDCALADVALINSASETDARNRFNSYPFNGPEPLSPMIASCAAIGSAAFHCGTMRSLGELSGAVPPALACLVPHGMRAAINRRRT